MTTCARSGSSHASAMTSNCDRATCNLVCDQSTSTHWYVCVQLIIPGCIPAVPVGKCTQCAGMLQPSKNTAKGLGL